MGKLTFVGRHVRVRLSAHAVYACNDQEVGRGGAGRPVLTATYVAEGHEYTVALAGAKPLGHNLTGLRATPSRAHGPLDPLLAGTRRGRTNVRLGAPGLPPSLAFVSVCFFVVVVQLLYNHVCATHSRRSSIHVYSYAPLSLVLISLFFVCFCLFCISLPHAESASSLVEGRYGHTNSKLIYGTFTTPSNSIPGSAVCAFSLQVSEGGRGGPNVCVCVCV